MKTVLVSLLRFPLLVVCTFTFCLAVHERAVGEDPDESRMLSVERIFGGEEFKSEDYKLRWLADGNYTRLEQAADKKGLDLVRYETETGDRTIMIPAAMFVPEQKQGSVGKDGESRQLTIDDYQWSEDLSKLLIYTNSRKVWRKNTRGDYWVLDRNSNNLRQLGAKFPASTLMFATFSPDASQVAYVHDNDIYVEPLTGIAETGDSPRRLTAKSSDEIINGTFDWVYEEEFSIRNGFRWSPDGKRIAFWRLDTSQVPRFTLIDNTSARYPTIKQFGYPKAGETNPDCHVGVIELQSGFIRIFEFPGDSREHYIPKLSWANDSRTVVVQRLNRLQNTNSIWLVDSQSGNGRIMFTDHDKAWVDVDDDFHWTKDGRSFLWSSEKDGWNRLYLISSGGSQETAISSQETDVKRLLKFDDASCTAWYLAAPGEPESNYLYRTQCDDPKPVRLTPGNQPGTHSYNLSPDNRYAVHRYSRLDKPTVTELIRLADHSVLRTLEDNSGLREELQKVDLGETGFVEVEIEIEDGKKLQIDGWQILPPDFDPSKKYPMLVYIYGEPAGQTVLDRWGGSKYLWHQMMAQHGFIVMSFDCRGTPAPRGRTWRKSIYRRMGDIAVHDHAKAVESATKQFPFIDSRRIGIWGWSGGGTMSLHAIFKHPEIYKLAISVAPVPDLSYYDTIYQERYMGLPQENKQGYEVGSAINHAENLQGKLLLVHGTGDDNCHYQTTELLIDKLIEHKKQFQMMAYPNRSHSISEGKQTTIHLREMMTNFVLENL